jgi:pimeloyl-ACP methyl ester carboxylesterase
MKANQKPRHRHRFVALFALVASLGVASNILPSVASAAKAPAKTKTKIAKAGKLSWKKCEDSTLLCAELAVPLDRADPKGERITLSLQKRPAIPKAGKKIGVLMIGAGLPGFSNTAAMTRYLGSSFNDSWQRFDVVSVDHRGTGGSTPVVCATSISELGIRNTENLDLEKVKRNWIESCIAANVVTEHMTATDSAFDLEEVRKALGVTDLSFQYRGFSSQVAATYQALFPTRVSRMVLVDPYPVNSPNRYVIDQAAQTEGQLTKFIEACVGSTECPLNSGTGPAARVDALLAKVKATPIPVSLDPDDGTIGTQELSSLMANLLPVENQWAALAKTLAKLETDNTAGIDTATLEYAISPFFLTNEISGRFWATVCENNLYPRTDEELAAFTTELNARAPRSQFAFSLSANFCLGWPIPSNAAPPLANTTVVPNLVIHFAGEDSFPDAWSNDFVAALGNAQLLSITQDWESCATNALRDYLESRVLPPAPATC